ncbi:NFX1-type zinc finger protein, partial [Rhizoctonia solani AG-3 Rhs1AP]
MEDAQLYLREFVEGNGIVRLTDAVRYPMNSPRSWSFQRGYVPIFVYLTSESVIKKGLHADINKLYGVIHNNFKTIRDTIETHMPRLIKARSFKDGHKPLSGRILFKAIFSAIHEYVTRFKVAASNPDVRQLVERMAGWFDTWAAALSSNPPFDDECVRFETYQKESIIENIDNDKERLLSLVKEPVALGVDQGTRRQEITEGLIANLQRILDNEGPGHLCKEGPRHDNDHDKIRNIGVAPTPDELLCDEDPYLPGNFFEAPHHLEPRSVQRLFDIQFRLLREEMMAPVRRAVQSVVSDLKKPNSISTTLSEIIRQGGGRYVTPDTQDSVMFSVFTNITFHPLSLDTRGISLGIEFDTPPGDGQSDIVETRVAYWDRIASKRLTQGALIALIWKDPLDKVDIYIGTVTSTPFDLVASARQSSDRVSIKVSFLDPAAEFRSKHELKQIAIRPPFYSIAPSFSFDLTNLFPPDSNVWSLALNPSSPSSIKQAKTSLLQGSRLDPSQVDAVVDSLTREVSLIQGPPGTGKSYTGLELIRVLVKSGVAPILMVAFTNHVLDHMLKGILDNEITDQIIRLGSRFAADERLAGFSLEELESNAPKSKPGRPINSARRAMGEIEDEMDRLMKSITRGRVPGHEMEKYLASAYPGHYHELVRNTPAWISALFTEASGNGSGWNIAGRQFSGSMVDFWLDAKDLKFLEPPAVYAGDISQQPLSTFNRFRYLGEGDSQVQEEQDPVSKHQQAVYEHIQRHGLHVMPSIPTANRLPRELQSDPKVWSMSFSERRRLYNVWYMPASQSIRERQLEEFEDLRRKHIWALEAFNKAKEEYRANLLREAHIVGCTTTGAAKLVSLLSEMRPKVLIVEEAGQVLESHILATLVGSVNHLIMIGDPLQLRPNINSWKLSSDNPVTGKIYRFNESLMERLARNGFPMTQLDVQRRMRPSISSLIRTTLYPNLQDNAKVLSYPDVRGMDKNVLFISHENLERGGGEDSVSKHNEFEINLIYDLVAHLLRQGCYNEEGNIVVLAAYLGQVPKIQQKLQSLVTTVVDDRDAEALAEHGVEETELATTREIDMSKRVLVRSLDNFQGEEGDVIILSLVRNSGTRFNGDISHLQFTGGKSPIGFLKSKNRTNVGLSRAKHGLYVFGNAPELARGSDMWARVTIIPTTFNGLTSLVNSNWLLQMEDAFSHA